MESINICIAYLPDLMIDYPNAMIYAKELIDRAFVHQMMTQAETEKYKLHINNIDDEQDEDDDEDE